MQTVKLQAGEVLYRAGDISDKVYFIEAGEVEVRRVMDHQEVTVATLGKGQMLGEMGVVRNCVRSTTIVAATPLTLASIDTNEFKEAFGGEKGVGLKLLRMICDRLCATTEAVHVAGDPAHSGSVAGMQLLGASPELQSLLGVGGIVIQSLPFVVGLSESTSVEIKPNRLGLPMAAAGQLGEDHFQIEAGPDGALIVRDLESWLGSVVNGRRISTFERFETGAIANLHAGDNEIIAGGQWSPIRFTLRLSSAMAGEAAA